MDALREDIAAFKKMQDVLEEKHMGKWVLFHKNSLISVFDSFQAAAEEAVKRFGRGPYLIRQVGMSSVTLPASVMFCPQNG
jgi:hypothetical protein